MGKSLEGFIITSHVTPPNSAVMFLWAILARDILAQKYFGLGWLTASIHSSNFLLLQYIKSGFFVAPIRNRARSKYISNCATVNWPKSYWAKLKGVIYTILLHWAKLKGVIYTILLHWAKMPTVDLYCGKQNWPRCN